MLTRRFLALSLLALALLPAALACTVGVDCACDGGGLNCVCSADFAQTTG